MTLPILLSVPHAGLHVPPRLADRFLLRPEQVVRDGDEGAGEIFALAGEVRHMVTTPIARAVLDMNRREDDVRKDGVVKTHSCLDEPLWRTPLDADERRWLIESFHRPYHARLTALAGQGVVLGVDGHTMFAVGPPVGPDAGRRRPEVCIGTGDGACPPDWAEDLASCFRAFFPGEVSIDEPFRGGHITRSHGREMPWVQLELARTEEPGPEEKRQRVFRALARWCDGRRG